MKSLTLETTQDHPSSLRSSQELPVETSIEDIIFSSNSSIQMDAAPAENLLQQKLDGEYKYHKYGSRMDQQESQHASGSRLDPLREERNRRVSNNPSYEKASTGESAARNKEGPERERYLGLSSPEEPKVFPNTSDINQKTEVKAQPCNYPGMYNSPGTVGPVPGSPYSYGMGAPFPYNPEFQRMYSLPAGFPVPESDATQGMPFSPITLYPPQDKENITTPTATKCVWPNNCYASIPGLLNPNDFLGTGNWIINNASGVQIGNYNHLSIGNQTISSEPCQSSPQSNCPVEMIQMFENNPVEEEHLQLLRDNLGRNWKHCARKLGITEPEIEVIDHDYERDGLKEKVYQMLEMWKMREGQRGTTVGKLLRALQDSKGDLLNKLLQRCKNMQSP